MHEKSLQKIAVSPTQQSRWHVIYCKLRQEQKARENLANQGYECYLPMVSVEKRRRDKIIPVTEALFSRYLFIKLGTEASAQSWAPIRSTLGVSRLVSFGNVPAAINDEFINDLQDRENRVGVKPIAYFNEGDEVIIANGAFAGIDAIFQMPDGGQRALVLIDMMGKATRLPITLSALRKAN